jgi:hypothetical protein
MRSISQIACEASGGSAGQAKAEARPRSPT